MNIPSSLRYLNSLDKKTISTWLILGIAALFFGLFVKLTFEVAYEGQNGDQEVMTMDHAVLQVVAKLRNPVVTASAVDLTALGSTVVLSIFVTGLAILFWMKRDRLSTIQVLVGAIGAGIFSKFMKIFFERERPEVIPHLVDVNGFSYPSGHSLSASAIYLAAALIACRYYKGYSERVAIFLFSGTLIAAIGFSRIYLGVHFPSDVAAGIFFGAAWAFLLAVGMDRLSQRIAKGNSL